MKEYKIFNEESMQINLLKFISIIFVVYIHSVTGEVNFSDITTANINPAWLTYLLNIISQSFARSAVPIFFLVSGVLFFKSSTPYFKMLRGKIRFVLVPYLLWNTLWVVLFFIFQHISFTQVFFGNSTNFIANWDFSTFLRNYGISVNEVPGSSYPLLYPLWFMRDLMVMFVISPILRVLVEKLPKVTLLLLIVLWFIPSSIPYETAIISFTIGGCLVNLGIHLTEIKKLPYKVVAPLYLLLVIIKVFVCDASFIRTAVIFIGMFFWVKVAYDICNSKYYVMSCIKELTQYVFIIYVGHEMSLTFMKKLISRILPTSGMILGLEYLLMPIIITAACIVVGMLMKKHMRSLYNLLTGGR